MLLRRLFSFIVAAAFALTGAVVTVPADAAPKKRAAPAKKLSKGQTKAQAKKLNAKRAAKAAALAVARQEAKERNLHATRAVALSPAAAQGADDELLLRSNIVLVEDHRTGSSVIAKNTAAPVPIASITKLMTAMIVLDHKQDLLEQLSLSDEDIDTEKGSRSRLTVGSTHSRATLLQLALMSSENRAAAALTRHFTGGRPTFVDAMNAKAKLIGMEHARFVDGTGLSSQNVASASDLAKLVRAAYEYPLIRKYSTADSLQVDLGSRVRNYVNTNRLTQNEGWNVGLSKTGFINEAGRCLVMQAYVEGRPLIFVLLDSWGKNSRIGDAARIREWLEKKHAKRTIAASTGRVPS